MSKEDEIIQRIASKILDSIERASNMSQSGGEHQVRYGRGGNANGVDLRYSGKAMMDTGDKVDKSMATLSKTSDMVIASLKRVIKTNETFGLSIKDNIEKVTNSHRRLTESTKKITELTLKQIAAQGINNDALKQTAFNNIAYSNALSKVIALTKTQNKIDEAKKELAADELRYKTLHNSKARSRHSEEMSIIKERIEKAKELLESEKDVTEAMTDATDTINQLSGTILDNNVAFGELDGTTRDVIKNNNVLNLTLKEQEKLSERLNNNTKDYIDTIAEANRETLKQQEVSAKKMDAVHSSLVTTVRAIAGASGGIVDNFREQLKFNVRESGYYNAASMGMSDGQLSKFLGSNADVIRGITGQSDLNAMTDGDMMKTLHRQVQSTFGESGAEGAQRMAQLASILQGSGISTRGNPGLIGDRISSYGAMSERLGMPKAELADLIQSMTDSGDMALMATRYAGMDPAQQAKAMDAEIEARIANNKMLGYSTTQMKEQLATQRRNQFGDISEVVKRMIGGDMFASGLADRGIKLTEYDNIAIRAVQSGVADKDQRAAVDRLGDMKMGIDADARIAATARYTKTGDLDGSGLASLIVERQTDQQLGTLYSSDAQQEDFIGRRAAAMSRYGADYANHLRDGSLSSVLTGPGIGPDGYNTSLGIGDQAMNTGRTLYDGVNANPLANAGKALWTTAVNTGIMVMQQRAMMGMGMLPGGKGGGLGGKGGAMGRGVANLSAIGGKIPGGARLGMGARAALGGGATLGVGLAGMGLSMWGDHIKATGGAIAADGTSANNTILDSDTLGSTMSIGGSALSGAGTGALIGSFIPVLGTAVGGAIGGVIGAAVGAWNNRDTIERNFNTIYDGAMADSPSQTFSRAEMEAKAAIAAAQTPQELDAATQALLRIAENTERTANGTEAAATEAVRLNQFYKSSADIDAIVSSITANQQTTADRLGSGLS